MMTQVLKGLSLASCTPAGTAVLEDTVVSNLLPCMRDVRHALSQLQVGG